MVINTDSLASEKMLKGYTSGSIRQWQGGTHWWAKVNATDRQRQFSDYQDARRWLLHYVYARNIKTY